MRITFFILLSMLCFIACKRKTGYTGTELEQKLKTTLQQYLYNDKNTDSTKVKYDITTINYFDDSIKNSYICEFKVHMHIFKNNYDTTGTMKANVSRDFTKVQRTY